MEWSQETTFKFIELYQELDILWNPKHPNYFHKILKNDAWVKLAFDLSTHVSKEISVEDCRKKVKTLMSSLRREKAKLKESIGKGKDEIYKTTWFAFESLQFLLDKDTPRRSRSTMDEELSRESTENNWSNPDNTSGSCGVMEIDNTTASTCPPPPRRKRKSEDPRLEKTFKILEEAGQHDESSAFGLFVGKKLKTYSAYTRSAVQHAMSGILFKADRGFYEDSQQQPANTQPSTSSICSVPSPASTVGHEEFEMTDYSEFL